MFCITLTLLFFCLSMCFCVVDHYFFLSCSCLSFNSNVCSFRAPRLTQIKLPCCDANALSKTLKKTRNEKKTLVNAVAVIIHAVVVLLVSRTEKQNESRKGVVQRNKKIPSSWRPKVFSRVGARGNQKKRSK